MGDAVAQQVQIAQGIVNVPAHPPSPDSQEGVAQAGQPQRALVAARQQEPPEPERELGHDPAGTLGPTERGRVALTPFLDLIVIWNTGISYGLFQQQGLSALWALLAFKVAAVVLLWIWLARASSRLTAVALGLIIGGALGNAIDRLHWPGVMDFVLFHIDTAAWSFRWYVFNLADVAIVAGVVGLLYESLRRGDAAKAP